VALLTFQSTTESPTVCKFGIAVNSGSAYDTIWTLGKPFIRQYCVVHDFQSTLSLGLAIAVIDS
jgi:hypothetical protein